MQATEQWSENESSKRTTVLEARKASPPGAAVAQTELSTALEAVEAAISVIEFGLSGC